MKNLPADSQYSQNYLTPILVDSYLGTRLNPLSEYNGFEVNKSINQAVGYRAINNDDTGNGALSGFTAKGSGSLYTNGTTLNHFGANYYVPYFAGNGTVLSNKKLLLGTTAGSDLELFTGTTISNVTSKLIIKNNGQLEIPIEPTDNNLGKLIGRLSNGKVVSVTLPVNAVTNTTIIGLSSSDLDSQYPTAVIGFRVQCLSISTGSLIYEKTPVGWVSTIVNIVN